MAAPRHARARNKAGPGPRSVHREKLVYVSDSEPGLRRRRRGNGFSYLDAKGRPVRDRATLARIRALAIPPAYHDVWICRRANGHLQASGRDARGRKQYRYHVGWRQMRSEEKFERIVAFGAALPRLRRRLRRDLARTGFEREKILAIVVATMADTLLRVGNDEYVRANRSYGLTTLRNRDIEFLRGGRVRLQFRGKGGQVLDVVIDNDRLARLIRHCQHLPGQLLFQYRDDDGKVQPVESGMVNDYLRDTMGEPFTAKDFRTWGGTVLALQLLASQPVPLDTAGDIDQRALTAIRNEVIAQVATRLSNTPAVCRKAYIDPAVFEAWEAGKLPRFVRDAKGARQWELAALRLLRHMRSARRRT
jgi:DNA topoisomerase I